MSSYEIDSFQDFFCGSDPWGPWDKTNFTFCFDGLYSFLFKFIFIF